MGKRKVGTILDDDLYRRAQETARRQGQSISHLLAAALKRYLGSQTSGASVVTETQGTYKVASKALKAALEEDLYDAGCGRGAVDGIYGGRNNSSTARRNARGSTAG